MINSFILSVILLTLPSASYASDAKNHQSSNNLCIAHVKDNLAAFYFPIIDNEKWVWFKNSTKDNALEYSWEIEIGSSENSYKFGYYLFKFPGQKQKEGSLQTLLSYAQKSVFESVLKPVGGTTGSLRDDLKVQAGIVDGGVVLGIKDVKTFNAILKNKPKTAKFNVRDSAAQNSFSCNAIIEYIKP